MAQSVDPTQPSQPGASSGHRSRLNDEDSVRAPHQGQQSTRTAPTGRTHDCKRPLRCTPNDLLPGGGHPHMRRREFITLLGGAAVWPVATYAQQPQQMRRVAFLTIITQNDPDVQLLRSAFHDRLHELGWFDGRDIRIDYRWAGPEVESLRAHATELVQSNPDLIVADSTAALTVLRPLSSDIPVVFLRVSDPVGAGFVNSLARPGGNLTGITNFEFAMGGKWLQLLKQIAPLTSQIGRASCREKL